MEYLTAVGQWDEEKTAYQARFPASCRLWGCCMRLLVLSRIRLDNLCICGEDGGKLITLIIKCGELNRCLAVSNVAASSIVTIYYL
jgi:hypothetical protein